MDTYDFLSSSLALPANAIAYAVSEKLAQLFPERAVLEGELGHCDVEKYAAQGLCTLELKPAVHNQLSSHWDEVSGIWKTARNAWYEVAWKGHALDCLILTWTVGFQEQRHIWVIADDEATARSFYSEVCGWNAELHEEVLVFDGGCWQKSDSLFRASGQRRSRTWSSPGAQGGDPRGPVALLRDAGDLRAVRCPLEARVLFIGPAGNGKTHAVKAIVNATGKPCLYVKSFQAEHMTEHDCIRQAFHKARKSAPCILVLEDLDSLINANNRSFFLNELDGFAANTGVVALATTNHPERLDASILDRPSRFDRKYHFDIPGPPERLAYVRLWAASLRDALHPSEAGLEAVVEQTEGYSFAYLKELFLSSMMRWIAAPGEAAMDQVLLEQCESLRHQMATAPPEPSDEAKPDATGVPPWMRHLRGGWRRR